MLDFSGHSVEDSFLLATLPAFSKLRVLSLNTSRKLSHHFVLALLGQSGASLHFSAVASLSRLTCGCGCYHPASRCLPHTCPQWVLAKHGLVCRKQALSNLRACLRQHLTLPVPGTGSNVRSCAAQAATTTAPAWRASACSDASSSAT